MAQIVERCDYRKGDYINQDYKVQSLLGNGTFGVVYLVSSSEGNDYALKLLKLWEVPSEVREPMVARFDMEYETGKIKSKYLVQSHAHGYANGNPYIVMDYCPGGDLFKISNQGNLDLGKVAYCVLSGLKSLHQNGKVHRDLKPENVLQNATGDYVLTDFGIAGDRTKRLTERNIIGKPKQIFGTYAYMPPEQVTPHKDSTVLPTTDIFSFGVMMFQLITGQLPFGILDNERNLIPYLKNGKNGNWNRQLLINSRIGSHWLHTIEGCLRPQLKDRFQNTDEVLKTIPYHCLPDTLSSDFEISDFSHKVINGILLRVMQGDNYGKLFYLDDLINVKGNSILLMGRTNHQYKNDIEIDEIHSSYISRAHCTLELDYNSGQWVIRDGQWTHQLNGGQWKTSTNGTFVNSKEVNASGMSIVPGDIISIGDTKLRVEGY